MAGLVSQFDRRKAIEAILYLANRLKRPDVHSICKVLYQADRHNLQRYGQFIAGDFYCAMEFGPVPSGVYDLINERGAGGDLGFIRDGNAVVPSRDADTDWLSEADVESLDRAIETHSYKVEAVGSKPIPRRRLMTDESRRLDHYKHLNETDKFRVEVDIEEVASNIVSMNYGVHRLLSAIVRYLLVDRPGDRLALGIAALLDEGLF